MPTSFANSVSFRQPEDHHVSPLATLRRVTTSDGNAGGTTLVDSFLTGLTTTTAGLQGLTLVINPDSLFGFEVSTITNFNAVNGTLTVSPAFSHQILAGTTYGFCTAMAGVQVTLPLGKILQETEVRGSVGPANFFAAPVNVVTVSPTVCSIVDGLYFDVSGLTPTAMLTATVNIKVGAGNVQRQVQRNFDTTPIDMVPQSWFPVIDTPTLIKGTPSSLVVSLQSSIFLDAAATVRYLIVYRQVGSP